MNFSFGATLGTDGFMGALLIPEYIAGQLSTNKIKRVVVTVSFNGKSITMHAGVLKKKGVVYLMFSKAKRKELGTEQGDTLHVSMKEDASKYQAPMTEELEAVLLSDYEAFEIFESLLPGKQRNIIFSVFNINDPQKRVDKALNAMENLKLGNLDPFKFDRHL
jgi:hypothetical protein